MRASRPITRQQTAALVTRLRDQTLPRLTANLARRELARVQGSDRRPHHTFVDGRENAPLDSVRPGGQIRFVFPQIGSTLDWIWEQLVSRSPVGPERGQPHYRDVHWLFVDGERVDVPEGGESMQISGRSLARFVNPRPYARRLEQGWSLQAPDGVYELVAMEAQRRFNGAVIEFSYVDAGEIPAAIPWPTKGSYAYPCITVRVAAQ
jgi:hypothetical protein